MHILFVCNQGLHRSRTAEMLFKDRFETRSKGLFNDERLLLKSDLEWADIIVVMEDTQRKIISERFPQDYLQKRIICFDIPDYYSFLQPELVELIHKRFQESFIHA